jgi:hypothetical protein
LGTGRGFDCEEDLFSSAIGTPAFLFLLTLYTIFKKKESKKRIFPFEPFAHLCKGLKKVIKKQKIV